MDLEQWKQIKNFDPSENWGDPSKISFTLVSELDKLRDFIKTPIHILCGTQGKHVEGSLHYSGEAVDIMFLERGRNDLVDLFIAASRFGFTGIGVYPDWQMSGIFRGGLHLDVRKDNRRAYWMGVKGKYIELSRENMFKESLLCDNR